MAVTRLECPPQPITPMLSGSFLPVIACPYVHFLQENQNESLWSRADGPCPVLRCRPV